MSFIYEKLSSNSRIHSSRESDENFFLMHVERGGSGAQNKHDIHAVQKQAPEPVFQKNTYLHTPQ